MKLVLVTHEGNCSSLETVRGSSVSVVTRLRAGGVGFDSRQGQKRLFLAISSRPALGPHPLFYSLGIWGSFPGVKWPAMKLTIHHHVLQRLRMRGAVLSFPHTSSWSGARLRRGTLRFIEIVCVMLMFDRFCKSDLCIGQCRRPVKVKLSLCSP